MKRSLRAAVVVAVALLGGAVGATLPSGCAARTSTLDAARFVRDFEKDRRVLLARRERADWMRSTHITFDTERLLAQAEEALMAFMSQKVAQARALAKQTLDGPLARKVKLLFVSMTIPAPSDPTQRERLAQISTDLQSTYGKGAWCPEGTKGACRDLGALSATLATSRDPKALLDAWRGWRTISVPMRAPFAEYVRLMNAGARELGFADTGALWRSKYDMPPKDMAAEVDRLWGQVRPLYEQLHCYVRGKLSAHYGKGVVPPTGPLPAHVLGNMWAQDWSNVASLVLPGARTGTTESPLTAALKAKGIDARKMTEIAEAFFVSLGLQKLPTTFWERSMLTRPRDRDVVCHASAWPVDWYDDVRIKMCVEVGEEDFVTLHHELGHIYYYLAYKGQPTLFADSAHDGFHEALGDTIALSVTPAYLRRIGLVPDADMNDIEVLLRRALERVAFLPFGVMIDKWRWQVFSGETPPERYNASWWALRREYQGIVPPVARSESDFDPGAKYHVAGSVPYARYFLAHILQFQFHRGLCRAAGAKGPLHRCSIYGSRAAGQKLAAMMAMGLSRPWPDALEAVTGERTMDAGALLDYFAPLQRWLEKQNAGQRCGW